MRSQFFRGIAALISVLFFSLAAQAQAGANQFDPRDFSGIWRLTGGGGATTGLGGTRPALTPRGMEILNTRIPSRSDDRITVTNPALSNYPTYQCNPDGFPNLLFDAEPFEFLRLNDRVLQVFQWEHRIRVLWTDGRQVPSGENLENLGPAWYGHSVGVWEGDTFVVTTVGLDDRAWLDRRGHPKSFHAKIEERYRRIDADTIQLQMTFTDPENYAAPWVSNTKTIKREPPESYTYFGWKGLFSGITEGICAPMNEVEGYNKRFRDPAAFGVK
jgi:hypothetical protein